MFYEHLSFNIHINMDTKKCSTCGVEKSEDDFYKKLNKKSSKCKSCTKISNSLYRNKNKEKLYSYRKEYYQNNKEELILYGQEYRAILDNKIKISENKKNYLKNNKSDIYFKSNKRRKDRRVKDPVYRLRNLVSRSVSRRLKMNSSSKKGGSIKDNLPYTIKELKLHLEQQFEPWMNWNNHGVYRTNQWDDNDQSTWMWQIDHIIPQCDLPYTTMMDDNFKKCWALENLRPLSAKQNVINGVCFYHNKSKIK